MRSSVVSRQSSVVSRQSSVTATKQLVLRLFVHTVLPIVLLLSANSKLLLVALLGELPFAFFVVPWELCLALWLFIGRNNRLAVRCGMLTFGCFSCYLLWQVVIGADSCGCFGRLSIPPTWVLLFDLTAVAACYLRLRSGFDHMGRRQPFTWRVASCITLLTICGIPWIAALSDGVGDAAMGSGLVLLRPDDWVGKPLPRAVKRLFAAREIDDGQILLVRKSCDACNALTAPLDGDPAGGVRTIVDFDSLEASTDYQTMWLVPVPTSLTIRRGLVVSAEAGEARQINSTVPISRTREIHPELKNAISSHGP